MRVNVYSEDMPFPPRIEIVEKEANGQKFTGVRFYLAMPVTLNTATVIDSAGVPSNADNADIIREAPEGLHAQGPFMHGPDDDDSSAVTFWGKSNLRVALSEALDLLDAHYEKNR